MGSFMYCVPMIHTLFKNRTGLLLHEPMYPPRIQTKVPFDLFHLFFTKGEYTSIIIKGETFPLAVSDGQPLFSPNHNFEWSGIETFSNILPFAPPLSATFFYEASQMLARFHSIPDTLITGRNKYMFQKVKELQQYFDVKRGWKINHIVIPYLEGDFGMKYRWFLADSRKSTCHYKKLPAGFHEICVFTFDWIVASLSKTCPSIEE